MYDFRPDIDDLAGSLGGLYGDVGRAIEQDVDGIEDGEPGYNAMMLAVDKLERIKVKGNVAEIDESIVSEFGKKGSTLPFAVAFGATVLNARVNAFSHAVEPFYTTMRKQTNERFHGYRTESKGIDRFPSIIADAKRNIPNIPDKVALGAPFKVTIPIAVDETMARRFKEFNKGAQEFLAGKEFKIRTTEMTANLKSSLQGVLSTGFAKGETQAQLIERVRKALGPNSNATTIAITEVAGAVNFGEYEFAEAYKDKYEVEMWKTWMQLIRSNMRKSHTAVAGETLKLNERFSVGGQRLLRPHDPDADASNTIRCSCYLDYETGDAKIQRGADERGVKNAIEVEEGIGLDKFDPIPYVNAQRIGAFVNEADGTEYMKDVYGIGVSEGFTLDQVNAMADVVDVMPYDIMLKNLQLTEVFATGAGEGNVAAYRHGEKSISWNMDEVIDDADFRQVFTHEIGHSLHYADHEFFEKFANISWKFDETYTNKMDMKFWSPRGPQGFFREYSETNPKEHFADAVAWYINRNTDFRELASYDEFFAKMFELFEGYFGPVKP